MAFTSPTSNSGFKAPSAILKGEFGLVADENFTPTFSGKRQLILAFTTATMRWLRLQTLSWSA